jgi:hypothetical protein
MKKPLRFTIVLISFYLAFSFAYLWISLGPTSISSSQSDTGLAGNEFSLFSINNVQSDRIARNRLLQLIDDGEELIWITDRTKQNRTIVSAIESQLSFSPLSPILWNELLYRRLSLGLLDQETEAVFNNAIKLDSWYSRQRNRYVQICISYWPYWGAETRVLCKQMLDRTADQDTRLITRLTGLTESQLEVIMRELNDIGSAK